jgi:DNA-directed RNA polymerase sigma subunit (sigma70/sigma32)
MRKRERDRWVALGFEPWMANDHVKRRLNLRVLVALESGATLEDLATHLQVTIERVRQMVRAGKRHKGFLGSFIAVLVQAP